MPKDCSPKDFSHVNRYAPALPEAGSADQVLIKSVLAVMRVPTQKPARRSLSSGSVGSAGSSPGPLALCDVPANQEAAAEQEHKASCLVKVERLEDNLRELRSSIEAEAWSD